MICHPNIAFSHTAVVIQIADIQNVIRFTENIFIKLEQWQRAPFCRLVSAGKRQKQPDVPKLLSHNDHTASCYRVISGRAAGDKYFGTVICRAFYRTVRQGDYVVGLSAWNVSVTCEADRGAFVYIEALGVSR